MWQAPCPEGSTAQSHAPMDVELEGTGRDQKLLLKSHVDAFCHTIVHGMQVSCLVE